MNQNYTYHATPYSKEGNKPVDAVRRGEPVKNLHFFLRRSYDYL